MSQCLPSPLLVILVSVRKPLCTLCGSDLMLSALCEPWSACKVKTYLRAEETGTALRLYCCCQNLSPSSVLHFLRSPVVWLFSDAGERKRDKPHECTYLSQPFFLLSHLPVDHPCLRVSKKTWPKVYGFCTDVQSLYSFQTLICQSSFISFLLLL